MAQRLALILSCAATLVAGSAVAAPQLKFLSEADVDPTRLLPPAPTEDSAWAMAELAELQATVAHRSAADLAAAKVDEDNETPSAFSGVFGPGFDLQALPATSRMLNDVQAEEKIAAKRAKDYFQRRRPWLIDPNIDACTREEAPKSSYPSGHATMGYAIATALAAAAPDKAPALMQRAQEYGQHRIVCGMHFRADIVAGQVLGTTVTVELLRTPAFRAEFDAAHSELVAAHWTAP
jgi:acid phosphatase (class A)